MYLLEMKTADLLLAYLIPTTVLLVVIAQHNLTPFGTATQSSSYGSINGRPENAINPPISNQFSMKFCSHTTIGNSSTPDWWMFQFFFGSAFITNITIYYREGFARRMDGFKLCLTNTSTTPPDNDTCYKDPGPGLPNIDQTISWNKLGKYVIYYDDKGSTEVNGRYDGPVIELCYIAINENNSTEGDHAVYASNTSSGWKSGTVLYKEKTLPTAISFFAIFRYLTYVPPGCPPTHYGPLCNRSCPQNCKGPCDLESGICIFGCLNGWTGNTCAQACTSGRYGENCVGECSANCLIPQCNL